MHTGRISGLWWFPMPFFSAVHFWAKKTVETKSWKASLRKAPSVNDTYIALPGSHHSVSFCEKENQKKSRERLGNLLSDPLLKRQPGQKENGRDDHGRLRLVWKVKIGDELYGSHPPCRLRGKRWGFFLSMWCCVLREDRVVPVEYRKVIGQFCFPLGFVFNAF